MKIHIWTIGKPTDDTLKEAVKEFTNRINNYFPIEWQIIPLLKYIAALSEQEFKKKEALLILSRLQPSDFLVALDENGKQFTSLTLSTFLQKRANESTKNLVFLIGGAYGLDSSILKRANFCWSLSQLTFPHQLVRLLLSEQLYRACSILRNEKYHHQ